MGELEIPCMLSAIRELGCAQIPTTLESIRKSRYVSETGRDNDALDVMLDRLKAEGLVTMADNIHLLTAEGVAGAKRYDSGEFSRWMTASERSPAVKELCRRVYNVDYCRYDMMSEQQLHALIGMLHLNSDDRVLDLGCGPGSVTEYIADVTGAEVLGIDFAYGAIEMARERTVGKGDRLSFQVMDMDELNLPMRSFDAVLAIDTLYFVSDLNKTVGAAKDCLREGGRMGFFYSTMMPRDCSPDRAPGNTRLGRALHDHGLAFQTRNFTEDEREFWEKNLQEIESLRQEFEAEGNGEIYEERIKESRHALEHCRAGKNCRYLYHVTL